MPGTTCECSSSCVKEAEDDTQSISDLVLNNIDFKRTLFNLIFMLQDVPCSGSWRNELVSGLYAVFTYEDRIDLDK